MWNWILYLGCFVAALCGMALRCQKSRETVIACGPSAGRSSNVLGFRFIKRRMLSP